MATLAELWDDTPAAKPLPAAPKLTVVPATPPPPPPPPPAPPVQAAPGPQPAPAPAPAPVLQAAPAPPPVPRPAPAPAAPPMAAAPVVEPAPVQMAPAPATKSKTVIPKIEFAERDVDARRIQEAELARLRQKLQTGPQPLTEEQKQASVLRTQGDINALERILKQPQTTFAAAPAAAASAPQKGSDVGSLGDLFETTIPANQPGSVVQKPVAKPTAFAGTRGDTGIGGGDGPIAQAALKYLKNLGAATASLADVTIAGIIPAVAGPVTYAAGRMFGQTPEQAAAAEKSVVETLDKPFGKTFGVSETGAYKGELSREVMDFIGANIGKGAKYISEKTGLPESDIANMMGTGLVGVAPLAGKAVKPMAGAAGEVLYAATEPLVRDKTVLAQRPKIEPTLPPQPLDVNLRPVEVTMPTAMSPKMLAETQAAFAKRQEAAAAAAAKAAMPPPAAGTAFDILGGDRTPAGPAVALPAGAAPGAGLGATPSSVGAAAVSANPFAGKLTGEVAGSKGQFPQVKLSLVAENVPVMEQQLISRIAQEVNPGQPVRSGVITRNEGTLRTEHTEANMPNLTPRGQVLKTQIANEQNALTNFSKERIDATGASPTLLSDSMRGERINDVFHGATIEGEAATSLTSYLDQSKRQIYKSALERVGSNQIKTSNIDNLLKNPQWKAGLEFKGVEGVAKGAEKYLNLAKTTGFEDVNGVMHPPGTVSTYDAVRKAVNAEWSPQNASAIRKINEAIDKDIAAVADPALYKLGDKIHQVEKTIFGSKGIKSLFGEVDKNGVVLSSTPLEKIPTKLNELAKDQWKHIRGTLDELANGQVRGAPSGMPPVPAELRQAAAAARNEIDGALARAVYQAGSNKAGVWNQNSVNTTLNSVIGEKILENFSPAEVKKFHTLNTAGYLMPGVHSYEGAALQARRAGKIEAYAEKAGIGAGAATGGFVGSAFGPAGTTAGTVIGGEAGRRVGAAISGSRAAKAEAKAADALRNEMQKNAQLRDMLP